MKHMHLIRQVVLGLMVVCAGSFSAQAQDTEILSVSDSLQLARKHLSFGNNYLKIEQYEDAETQLLKAWQYVPKNEQNIAKQSQCARLLGRLYHKTEKYDQAISWYQKAVGLSPNDKHNKSAYRALADLYQYQQMAPEAIDTFEKLLTYDVDSASEIEYLYQLVVLTNETQDFERALKYVNRWAELTPDDPRVQELLGKLHMRTGDEDEAIAQMEKVVAMNPNDFKTLSELAAHHNKRGAFGKAFDAYEKLRQHNPDNFLYLENLRALAKHLQKPASYHIEILTQMHRLQPNNLSIIETLADMTEEAQWIQKGFQLDPNNGHLQFLMGEQSYKHWLTTKAVSDSTEAMAWYHKALQDPVWKPNAQHMINVINPPKTREQQIADDFFKGAKKEHEEVKQEGKK